jgi:hypothetical protein
MFSSMQRAALVTIIHKIVPQLEGISEGEWVTDWFLKKYIDQRVADTKGPEKGEKKIPTHGHVNFVGSVQDPLRDDNGHHVYLVRIQSWAGKSVPRGVTTALVCCVIPPWKAQSLERLRCKSTAQFVGR